MKYLDGIVITSNRYIKNGIPKGARGAIVEPEIRNGTFLCELFNLDLFDELHEIHIEDMKVTRESTVTDEEIKAALPTPDPKWWCKAENGYIINLLGERKNKIPYDYNS